MTRKLNSSTSNQNSSKHCSTQYSAIYLMQRTSAITLIPLSLWFISHILMFIRSQDAHYIYNFLNNYTTATFFSLFVMISMYHGYLGISSILRDYVKHNMLRTTLKNIMRTICIICAAAPLYHLIKLSIQ